MTEFRTNAPRWRFRGQWINLVLLTTVWVLLVGDFSLITIAGGFILAWLVTLVFPLPTLAWRGRLRPLGLVRLVLLLIGHLAKASWILALAAFRKDANPKCGVIALRLCSNSDLYQVATGSLLTIIPGSVVVDARRRTRTLYMHIFGMEAADLDKQLTNGLDAEETILKAFASNRELKAAEELRRQRWS